MIKLPRYDNPPDMPDVKPAPQDINSTVPLIRHSYCDGCTKFNPVLSTQTMYSGDEAISCDMQVQCKYYDLCGNYDLCGRLHEKVNK